MLLILVVVFIIAGILLIMGKAPLLVAGFSNKSKRERAKLDTDALSKFLGVMMFVLALSMFFWVLGMYYAMDWLFFVGFALFIAAGIFMIVYVSTGNRFRKGR